MAPYRMCRWLSAASLAGLTLISLPAHAWEMAGTKIIRLHSRDGQAFQIGTVNFEPKGEQLMFSVKMDPARLKDFFLSMREFKCLEGTGEIQCHVPYPYANPATVSATDFVWLELTEHGLVGLPQAIDLNQISAPHADLSAPPYSPGARSELAPDARWFNKLTIE